MPHVTLADQALAEDAGAALAALRHYRTHISFDRVVVLEEKHHRWHPLADAALGPPAVVGRGGLELEITEGRMPGPDVMAMAESQLVGIDDAEVRSNLAEFVGVLGAGQPTQSVVLTGRREGGVAGAAAAWQSGRDGRARQRNRAGRPGVPAPGRGKSPVGGTGGERTEARLGRRGRARLRPYRVLPPVQWLDPLGRTRLRRLGPEQFRPQRRLGPGKAVSLPTRRGPVDGAS